MSSKRHRPPYQRQNPPQPRPSQPAASDPAEAPAQEQAPVQRAAPPVHGDRIGDILRRVREHRGEDIESISDYLRIRPSFLIALENSRYDEIPADTYVIGFLRTYALYLGLDGKGAIEQYRREMAGRRRAPQLSMPQPMSEGRIPTVAILIAASVACLILYGLWYGLSTPDRTVIAQPVPLPATEEEAAPTPASEALSATPAGDLLLETTSGANAALSSLAANTATTPPAEQSAAPAAPQAAPPAAPKPAEQQAAPPPAEPEIHSFGAKGKTRLVIKADKESWVLVTDSLGTTVFDRTLKEGETYNVPPGRELRLTTGNVAGLTLTLDGATLPRLKSSADNVARNVPLDPDKIKSRTVSEKPASEKPAPAPPAPDASQEPSD